MRENNRIGKLTGKMGYLIQPMYYRPILNDPLIKASRLLIKAKVGDVGDFPPPPTRLFILALHPTPPLPVSGSMLEPGYLPSLPSIYLARDFTLVDSHGRPKLTALQNLPKKPSIN